MEQPVDLDDERAVSQAWEPRCQRVALIRIDHEQFAGRPIHSCGESPGEVHQSVTIPWMWFRVVNNRDDREFMREDDEANRGERIDHRMKDDVDALVDCDGS